MKISHQLASHMYNVYFGGSWSISNYRDCLKDINLEQATTKVYDLNTIAALVYHTNYYVSGIIELLEGGELSIKDEFSFDHPPFRSQEEWMAFKDKVFNDARRFSELIGKLPEDKLEEDFTNKKYGSYYTNLTGILEHLHYHLGQIVMIKKMINHPEYH